MAGQARAPPHLRAPVKIMVDREGVQARVLLRREQDEALRADELHVEVWLQVVVAVVERPRRADEQVDLRWCEQAEKV